MWLIGTYRKIERVDGRVASTTDRFGRTTTYKDGMAETFDSGKGYKAQYENGRLVRETLPDGKVNEY